MRRRTGSGERAPGRAKSAPRLRWDPIRPLTGRGDWLERMQLTGADRGIIEGFVRAVPDGFRLADGVLANPDRRRAVVGRLLALAERGSSRTALRADPAVRTILAHERARLDVACAKALEPGEVRRALKSMKRKLYRYQEEGLGRFLRGGRIVLADDMGLGKTAQAIAACHVLFETGRARSGVIIAPASLKSQWLREWQAFTDTPATLVEGPAEERARIWAQKPRGFLITNYEQVLRDLPVIHRHLPDIVVLDEAQRIKNWETKTARCVKELRPRYRLVLTGTPMENRLDELASVVEWVDDLALEPKWRLVPWHATAVDGKAEVGGARHIATLRERLEGSVVRRLREDVLDQLPSRTDTVIPVEFTPQQQEQHTALAMPIAKLVSIARGRPLKHAEFLRLMQLLTMQRMVANGMALFDFLSVWPDLQKVESPAPEFLRTLSSPKLLELREIIRQVVVEQKRKVIVFSQWRRMLTLAHWATSDLLGAAGRRAAFFTGEESQQQRTRNVIDLHDEPKTAALFLTDCGGVGLNLQRAASCCINLDLPWNPAVLEQRIGRIHRLGQTSPIDVYNLVTEDSLEARIAALVEDKRALFKGLFDGDADEIRYERSGTFMGRMQKLFPPEEVPSGPIPNVRAAAQDEDDNLDELAPDPLPPAEEAALAPATPSPAAAPPSDNPFAGVRITRRDDGGISLEAEAGAASTLAGLFEGFARMLRVAANVTP